MSETDVHSVILDISKPRVCAKTSYIVNSDLYPNRVLRRIMDRKPMKKPLDIVLDEHPVFTSAPHREETLLAYKLWAKKRNTEEHKQKLKTTLREKHKIVSENLRKRLYVEYPTDDVHAITDYDNSFFNFLNGHPITEVQMFKSLKVFLNDRLRITQEIGYRNDAILNIQVKIRKEKDMFQLSLQRVTEQIKCFDACVSEDYKKSIGLLKMWDQFEIKVSDKISELEHSASEQFTIMSRLMSLDYQYKIQQKYGRFLYYLSPPSWRGNNREFAHSVEIEATGFDIGINEEETFNVLFERMRFDCHRNYVTPPLYFAHPRDLLDIFEATEKQQLNHFTHIIQLVPLKRGVNEELKMLKDIIKQDSALLVTTIDTYKSLVENCEERALTLESKFFKILNGFFYENVCTPDVLKLYLHLEFCYEKIYYEHPTKFDMFTIASRIEHYYMDYSQRLDTLRGDTIQKAVSQYIAKEQAKFRRAKLANKELRIFARLGKNLLKAFEPVARPMKNTEPDLNGTQNPQINPQMKKNTSSKSDIRKVRTSDIGKAKNALTESELEYLTLFTDWTENEDPSKYLHVE